MERVLADAAICFANTAGGIIIVGVCDKKKGIEAITGTNLDPDRVKQRIYELSRPHLNVEVTRHPDHENLLLISCRKARIFIPTPGAGHITLKHPLIFAPGKCAFSTGPFSSGHEDPS